MVTCHERHLLHFNNVNHQMVQSAVDVGCYTNSCNNLKDLSISRKAPN